MGSVSDSDDALSATPSDLSLVSDDQDTRTSAHDDHSRDSEGVLPREKAKPARHPVFLFEDDLVCLQVQGVMFTVHAHLFDSQSAQAFIERRRAAPDDVIIVEDILAVDLERFLTILYSKSYAPARLHTKEEWTSVLSLAHRWDSAAIRAVAIDELAAVTTPIDKLVLARDYGVDEWLAGAYLAVCEAPAYPSDADCARLDRAALVGIARAREALRAPGPLVPPPGRAEIVRRVFGLPDGDVRAPLAPESTACAVQPSAVAAAVAVPAEADNADPGPAVRRPPRPCNGTPKASSTSRDTERRAPNASQTLQLLLQRLPNGSVPYSVWNAYRACGTEDELDAFIQAISAARRWDSPTGLRSEDSCFVRLAVLEDGHRPFMEHFRDLQDRESALDKLNDTIEVYFRRASSDEKRDAIMASETSRMLKLCLDTQRWADGVRDYVSNVTAEEVLVRLRELDELAQSVFNQLHEQ